MSNAQNRISNLEADLEREEQATRRLMIERDHFEMQRDHLAILLHGAILVIEGCGEDAKTFRESLTYWLNKEMPSQ